jgi:hypothetical protein
VAVTGNGQFRRATVLMGKYEGDRIDDAAVL